MDPPTPRPHCHASQAPGGRARCNLLPASPRLSQRAWHAPAPGPLSPWPWHAVWPDGTGDTSPYRIICCYRPVPCHGDDVLAAPGRGGADAGGSTITISPYAWLGRRLRWYRPARGTIASETTAMATNTLASPMASPTRPYRLGLMAPEPR